MEKFDASLTMRTVSVLARKYISPGKSVFRKYINEQAPLSLFPFLVRAAQQLIPGILPEHLTLQKSWD